jgi:hypothetical protein
MAKRDHEDLLTLDTRPSVESIVEAARRLGLEPAAGTSPVLPDNGPLRVYLASKFQNQNVLRGIALQLMMDHGIVVTSRWLTSKGFAENERVQSNRHWLSYGDKWATADLEDVDKADIVLIYGEGLEESTGGVFAELGYCIATKKRFIWVGHKLNNVFCVKYWRHCSSLDEAVRLLVSEHERKQGRF